MKWIHKLLSKASAQLVATLVRGKWLKFGKWLLSALQMLSFRQRRTQRLMRVASVAQGASLVAANKKVIHEERAIRISPVRCLGSNANHSDICQEQHRTSLPVVGIYHFRNVAVIGGSEMLIVNDELLLYDELALGDPDKYGCKAFGIIVSQSFGRHLPAYADGQVLLSYNVPDGMYIPQGVLLCKDHSVNYYHWLFECLPRAIMVMQQPEFSGMPFLIDANIPRQSREALDKILDGREVILLGRRNRHLVGELVFPDVFSYTRDNYGDDIEIEDLLVAPEAVALLRQVYLDGDQRKGKRKLFVARDGARYRKLRNELQLQEMAKDYGFEIVKPEQLSFKEQVELFSEADAIVGPTGAGMSNMVFAPSGCKVLVLAAATTGANLFIFGQLGQWLEHNLVYVLGTPDHSGRLHSNYSIESELLEKAFVEMGLSRKAMG